ncbi:MAG: YraN family protein [Pseudomonadales bacterium]
MNQGRAAELRAQHLLWLFGVQIIGLNYQSRYGEIDIIGVDQSALIFFEVKWRSGVSFGTPAAQVDWRKQQRLLKTAEHFLQAKPFITYQDLRFDVLALGHENRWIKSAFYKEDLIPEPGLAR